MILLIINNECLIKMLKVFSVCIKNYYDKITIIIIINIYTIVYFYYVKNHIYKVIYISLYISRDLITNQ